MARKQFHSQEAMKSWFAELSPEAQAYVDLLPEDERPIVVKSKGRQKKEPETIVINCSGPSSFCHRSAHASIMSHLKGITIGNDTIIIQGTNRQIVLTQIDTPVGESTQFQVKGIFKQAFKTSKVGAIQEIAARVVLDRLVNDKGMVVQA